MTTKKEIVKEINVKRMMTMKGEVLSLRADLEMQKNNLEVEKRTTNYDAAIRDYLRKIDSLEFSIKRLESKIEEDFSDVEITVSKIETYISELKMAYEDCYAEDKRLKEAITDNYRHRLEELKINLSALDSHIEGLVRLRDNLKPGIEEGDVFIAKDGYQYAVAMVCDDGKSVICDIALPCGEIYRGASTVNLASLKTLDKGEYQTIECRKGQEEYCNACPWLKIGKECVGEKVCLLNPDDYDLMAGGKGYIKGYRRGMYEFSNGYDAHVIIARHEFQIIPD